jgi:hypothetical protein
LTIRRDLSVLVCFGKQEAVLPDTNEESNAKRARQLARSGKFRGWQEIESEMGVRLGAPFLRSELDRLCKAGAGSNDA